MMTDKPLETLYPLDTEVSIIPANWYDRDIVDILKSRDMIIHIPDGEIGKPGSDIGKISVQVVPEFRLTMKEIQTRYGLNQKDCYATMAVFGLSLIEHLFHPDLKRIRKSRRDDFFSGRKMQELVETFGTCEHFFEKQPNGRGGRKEVKLYGNKRHLIAAIGDNAEFFNLSSSDMAHIVLSHAIAQWALLPEDFRNYFQKVNARFADHARKFYSISLQVESDKGKDNRTIGQ